MSDPVILYELLIIVVSKLSLLIISPVQKKIKR